MICCPPLCRRAFSRAQAFFCLLIPISLSAFIFCPSLWYRISGVPHGLGSCGSRKPEIRAVQLPGSLGETDPRFPTVLSSVPGVLGPFFFCGKGHFSRCSWCSSRWALRSGPFAHLSFVFFLGGLPESVLPFIGPPLLRARSALFFLVLVCWSSLGRVRTCALVCPLGSSQERVARIISGDDLCTTPTLPR